MTIIKTTNFVFFSTASLTVAAEISCHFRLEREMNHPAKYTLASEILASGKSLMKND